MVVFKAWMDKATVLSTQDLVIVLLQVEDGLKTLRVSPNQHFYDFPVSPIQSGH